MIDAAKTLRAGLVQLRSGVDVAKNIEAASALIREAVDAGAQLVVTPEATNIVQRHSAQPAAAVSAPDQDPALQAFRRLARELSVVLIVGSLMQRSDDGRVANRCYVISSDGVVSARYDKIHLFDVTVAADESYFESRSVEPGARAVVASTPWGGVGLSVCYDLRFAGLYRDLAKAGANMIVVPAAFTRHTGRAHWEILLRARAIETGAYILAPGQGGRHEDGRATWGHSMMVDPWGEIVAQLDHEEPGVLVADLDLAKVNAVRTKIPSLKHERPFASAQTRDELIE